MKSFDIKDLDNYALDSVATYQMNRIMRHRLRNLCAGMKMAIDRIRDQTAETHPSIGDMGLLMISELDDLQLFTERMDLVFDRLPDPRKMSFTELIADTQCWFAATFPACPLSLVGPDSELVLRYGSWLQIALRELLCNAADAADDGGQASIEWRLASELLVTVVSRGATMPPDIPLSPAQPFFTHRSRHDGLGLAIVSRICRCSNGELALDTSAGDKVSVALKLPLKDHRI